MLVGKEFGQLAARLGHDCVLGIEIGVGHPSVLLSQQVHHLLMLLFRQLEQLSHFKLRQRFQTSPLETNATQQSPLLGLEQFFAFDFRLLTKTVEFLLPLFVGKAFPPQSRFHEGVFAVPDQTLEL